jgi:hypothetical protein
MLVLTLVLCLVLHRNAFQTSYLSDEQLRSAGIKQNWGAHPPNCSIDHFASIREAAPPVELALCKRNAKCTNHSPLLMCETLQWRFQQL